MESKKIQVNKPKQTEYRLLKDLPNVKAGTIFIREETICDDVYIPDKLGGRALFIGDDIRRPIFNTSEMPSLIKSGWFIDAVEFPQVYTVDLGEENLTKFDEFCVKCHNDKNTKDLSTGQLGILWHFATGRGVYTPAKELPNTKTFHSDKERKAAGY